MQYLPIWYAFIIYELLRNRKIMQLWSNLQLYIYVWVSYTLKLSCICQTDKRNY